MIRVNDADDLNYEDNTSLDITVEADDGSKRTSTTVTINLNNVNEAPSVSVPGSVFINEIHYDNVGVDTGEAIEIAGVAGNDLNGWQLVMYNGFDGSVYDTVNLSGTIPNQADNFGTLVFNFPTDGIQNATGLPDGIALVDPTGNVVQFLSYEGAFTATEGPANGMLSTDIGVSEDNGTTAVGESLQLTGAGATFTWAAAASETFGAINTGQDFAAVAAATRQTINEDGSLVFSAGNGNAIVVDDVDAALSAALDPVEITLSVGNGTLTLGSTTGLGPVAGNGSGSVVFTGTIAELNAALEGLSYQPNTDYSGSDTLTVLVDDLGNDGPGGAQTATGVVHITVNSVNDDPVADNESFTVVEGGTATEADLDAGASLLDGDTDADLPGDTLTVNTTPVVDVSHGTLTLNANGTFSYVHDGTENFTDSFTYEVSDGAGGTDTATVTITITPQSDNDPVADNESFTVVEGGTATEADLDAGTSLLDGDTDADLPGDTLTVNTTPVVDVEPRHADPERERHLQLHA